MTGEHGVRIKVNGEWIGAFVSPRLSLVDFLRQTAGATDAHVGCEQGKCGACTVQLDGRPVRGCLTLAVQADGREVLTVAGLVRSGRLRALVSAFAERNALQCGFCTPGFLISALDHLERGGDADRVAIREAISGNYCRCTGYEAIVDAVVTAAQTVGEAAE